MAPSAVEAPVFDAGFPWQKPDSENGLGQVKGKLIDHPSVWKASDFDGKTDHIYCFSDDDVKEIEEALKHALATGKEIKDLTVDDFPLPKLGATLRHLRDEVVFGRGFQLFRGLPVQRWSRQEVLAVYFGIGVHWGKLQAHSPKGELIHHVKDVVSRVKHTDAWLGDTNNPNTRLYATNTFHPYHTESGTDLVALLCLQPPKKGGEFRFASTPFIHNEVLKARPDLLETLTSDWHWDRMGGVFWKNYDDNLPFSALPILSYDKGYLNVYYNYRGWLTAQRFPETPKPTQAQQEAAELINSLAEEHGFSVAWQPGELALLNSHTHMHWRNAFEDGEDPSERRHLLRIYPAPPQARPLPEHYRREVFFGRTEVGNRGGIPHDPAVQHVPLYAEDGL